MHNDNMKTNTHYYLKLIDNINVVKLKLEGDFFNEHGIKKNSNMANIINANKLYLNVNKTHFIIFSFSNKRIVNTNDIVIDNQPVSRVSYTKFFGVIIDEKLNWSEHVNNLKIKLAKGSGIIRKCKIWFSIDTLITYSFIYPYITYCLEV